MTDCLPLWAIGCASAQAEVQDELAVLQLWPINKRATNAAVATAATSATVMSCGKLLHLISDPQKPLSRSPSFDVVTARN